MGGGAGPDLKQGHTAKGSCYSELATGAFGLQCHGQRSHTSWRRLAVHRAQRLNNYFGFILECTVLLRAHNKLCT